MPGTLRFILGDQLTRGISSLDGLDVSQDTILMVEVLEEATYVRHHQQKIALIFSAMRHFAAELRGELGCELTYIDLEHPLNSGSFTGELARMIALVQPDCVVVTEPGEWRVWQMMQDWREEMPVPIHIRPDTRFIASRDEFVRWAGDKKSLRMEFFYREMRRKTGLLMAGDEPGGGQWNFDHDNRKSLPAKAMLPGRLRFEPDAITREVLALVGKRFGDHFGDLEPFGWGVTRADALAALEHFIADCLPQFGDYQDAMKTGEPLMYHALISPYLNIGLLTALEVSEAAEATYQRGDAPLNAVEGFIRQVIGWREYIRGIYWLKMPEYGRSNALNATRKLPWFYWSGETKLNCLKQCIGDTKARAYAHHIQRLMVTGNFALLAGIDPAAVEEWYLIVYADAFEWVELPNVHGMVLFADGGVLGSKPYAASGAYIDRMSDYCGACAYDVKLKAGPKACPFNYLYWNFLIENEVKLSGNMRMAMPYRTLAKMTDARRVEIVADAGGFLDGMG